MGIIIGSGAFDDVDLFLERGIVHFDIEHEPVQLSFGQRIGALLLNGVLRGQDKERRRQRIALARHGDRLFLHGLEQSGLGLGGGAVYFISQYDIGEDRAFDELELAVLVEYFGPGDVGGHQVGSELYAVEGETKGFREGVDH